MGAADRAMLAYALRLTRHPHAVAEEGVNALRDAGFTDTAILDICQVTAYYNYVNRLAEGLNVALEPHWSADEMVVSEGEFRARPGPAGRSERHT
jgi:uncharacterized peroxidase-related enzyme